MSLAESMKDITIMPNMTIEMIAVGEATGSLEEMLENISSFYDEEIDMYVASFTAFSAEAFISSFLVPAMAAAESAQLLANRANLLASPYFFSDTKVSAWFKESWAEVKRSGTYILASAFIAAETASLAACISWSGGLAQELKRIIPRTSSKLIPKSLYFDILIFLSQIKVFVVYLPIKK